MLSVHGSADKKREDFRIESEAIGRSEGMSIIVASAAKADAVWVEGPEILKGD